ncbi:MAG: disulfide bond formation protein B [Azospirillaceae bacterium]
MSSFLRMTPLWMIALGVAMLGGALVFQYAGGLEPCILCLYQRWPWGIVIGIGIVAVILLARGHDWLAGFATGLGGVVMLAGAAIAAFHVGVEQGWWAGTAECGSSALSGGSVSDLTRQLLATPVVRCDEVAWSLFGISMAGYNFLISLAAGVLAIAGAVRLTRQPPV